MCKENEVHPTTIHYLMMMAPIRVLIDENNVWYGIHFNKYTKKNTLPLTGFACSESIHETHRPLHTSHNAISPVQSADTNSDEAPEIESNGTHKS